MTPRRGPFLATFAALLLAGVLAVGFVTGSAAAQARGVELRGVQSLSV
jgi:hypothetical protein